VDELRDIKPLLEIPDSSYVLFMISLLFIAIIILYLLYNFGKRLWENRKKNMREVYFKRLKSVDWSDSKKTAYEVTFLGRILSTEPRIEEIYKQLLPLLSSYKYQKVVPSVNEETLRQYDLLVHVVDESL